MLEFLRSDEHRDGGKSWSGNEQRYLQSRLYYSAACLQTAVLKTSEQLSLKDESRLLTILEDSLRILEQHRACAASRCKS